MADRVSQADVQILGVGTPKARVSQADAQILGVGAPKARVSQADAQILGVGTPRARVSQARISVLWYPTPSQPPYRRPAAPWLLKRTDWERFRFIYVQRLRPGPAAPPTPPPPPILSRRPAAPLWLFTKKGFAARIRRFAPIPPSPVRPFIRRLPSWFFTKKKAVRRRRPIGLLREPPLPFKRHVHVWTKTPAIRRQRNLIGIGYPPPPPPPATVYVTVAAGEGLTGGQPKLRVPAAAAEALTGGQPRLRGTVAAAEALTGGLATLRASVAGVEALSGGQGRLCVTLAGLEVLVAVGPEGCLTTLTFPRLRGRSWSTTKKPIFSTRISDQQSGKEVRSANYPYPRWEFDLTYEYLPDTGDLHTLLGFFLQCQGSFANFLYRDPSDFQVRQGFIATSDGTTPQWPFARELGGFLEPVGQVDTSTVATFGPGNVSIAGDSIALTMPQAYATGPILSLAPATGDGPYFVAASAGGELPGGLAALTPYWAINVGGDTIQLATTWKAAQAGNPVTLTSTGSGAFSLTKGYSLAGSGPEAQTVPASPGPYTVTVNHAATFLSDQGVTIAGTALTLVSGSPAAGQYAVDEATATYTFNAAQAGAASEISYEFQYPPSAFSLSGPNQALFSSPPPSGLTVKADFDFRFVCRFLDDSQEYENFMHALWRLQKCNFVAVPQ